MVYDRVVMARLFDLYGPLLSPAQRDAFSLHEEEDLSLAEIAQDLGVSRQGVHDRVTKAREKLIETERLLGVAARLDALARLLAQAELTPQQRHKIDELLLLSGEN